MITVREKMNKLGAQIVRGVRYVTFRLVEIAMSRDMFHSMLRSIHRCSSWRRV